MSEFEELFGEWAVDGKGEPQAVTVTPEAGEGAWGQVPGDPVELTCPVFFGTRLVRAADGNQVAASVTLYPGSEHRAAFTLHARVQVGGVDTTVVRVDAPSIEGLFDFLVVYCE